MLIIKFSSVSQDRSWWDDGIIAAAVSSCCGCKDRLRKRQPPDVDRQTDMYVRARGVVVAFTIENMQHTRSLLCTCILLYLST